MRITKSTARRNVSHVRSSTNANSQSWHSQNGVGTRLRREWQGRTVEVEVEAAGFRWEGRFYPSLSAAATAIAGSRWNGPRFFGLREPQR